MNLNPNAFIIMWMLSLLMAGAIVIGSPVLIYTVSAVAFTYTVVAVFT